MTRMVAVGGQRGIEGLVVWRHPVPAPVGFLSFPGHHLQPLRRLARFHAPGGVRVGVFHVQTELPAGAEVALYLAVPGGQAVGIGQCLPQVIDTGAVAVFDAYDAFAACRSQAPQDAGTRTWVAGHLRLLRSRSRAILVCQGLRCCRTDVVPWVGRFGAP